MLCKSNVSYTKDFPMNIKKFKDIFFNEILANYPNVTMVCERRITPVH